MSDANTFIDKVKDKIGDILRSIAVALQAAIVYLLTQVGSIEEQGDKVTGELKERLENIVDILEVRVVDATAE